MDPAVCDQAAGRGTDGAPAIATLPHYASPVGGPMGNWQPAAAGPAGKDSAAPGRIVCQFSCGAASAVATKLARAKHKAREVVIVNAFLKEEDDDNRRFLADCETWFGQRAVQLRDEKYGASADEVWRRKQYMKGPRGAPCSRALKRAILDAIRKPDDVLVFGFTAEEAGRFEDFQERNPELKCEAPLIDAGVGKADCLAMVQRAGIQQPLAYRQGFPNANCKGCPKGGEGYWNHTRKVHPLVFQARLERQESLGSGAYFFRHRDTGERFGLKDLDPTAGRLDEPMPACSFFCEMAEQEYAA